MSDGLRILALPRYSALGASSRLRTYQFVPSLEARGYRVHTFPLFNDEYLLTLYTERRRNYRGLFSAYCKRLVHTLRHGRRYDLIWMEKELYPWLPAGLESPLFSMHRPVVVDYDDAVFHRYDQNSNRLVRSALGAKIDRLMRRASAVICGNQYLADRARRAGAGTVAILPTVVDVRRYATAPTPSPSERTRVRIGWIGTPITAKYLHIVAAAIRDVSTRHPLEFIAIGTSDVPDMGCPVETHPWREDSEVNDLRAIDVGIMPIPDGPFERGKCGYKLIQYMASGKPVVASPVGANMHIVRHGENGYLASDRHEWVTSLEKLCGDPILRERMGKAGCTLVEQHYSLERNIKELDRIFRAALNAKVRP